jgi:hypothetical protein
MATLLAIVRDHGESSEWFSCDSDKANGDLDRYELWRVIKEQVRILREDMDSSEPDEPDPDLDVTFHNKADRSAQGKATGVTPPRTIPCDKAEYGKMEDRRSKNIPVFSRRLTSTEARLSLQAARTTGEKVWEWAADPTF